MVLLKVRVKTVQVAIQDPVYADCIRSLLAEDGRHQVHLVRTPDVNVAGAIVLDAAYLGFCSASVSDQSRLIVMAHKQDDDLGKIWDAGVRHVIFYGDSLQSVCTAVLAVELSLSAGKANIACVISPTGV